MSKLFDIEVGNRLLTRAEVPAYLREKFGAAGALTAPYLAKLAWNGNGPPMVKIGGKRVAYRECDLVDWVNSRSRLVNSTSDEI
jgi:hypothetical protein